MISNHYYSKERRVVISSYPFVESHRSHEVMEECVALLGEGSTPYSSRAVREREAGTLRGLGRVKR